MEKTILGIDPGSYRMGVGCIQKKGSTFRLLSAEVIEPPRKDEFYPRLEVIAARLEVILDLLSPEEVAVEDVFHAINARSAFQLGVARGVAIGACLRRKIRVYEYPPTQVKSVVTGYGRADKAQVKKMVQLTVGATVDLAFDATDAIAVAICHASTQRFENKLRSP